MLADIIQHKGVGRRKVFQGRGKACAAAPKGGQGRVIEPGPGTEIDGTNLNRPIGTAAALARVKANVSSCLKLVLWQSKTYIGFSTGMPTFLFQYN